MKNTLITLGAAALLSMGSIAVADQPTQGPIAMTDAQMDQVVAGAGYRRVYVSGPGAPQGDNEIVNSGNASRDNRREGACVNACGN